MIYSQIFNNLICTNISLSANAVLSQYYHCIIQGCFIFSYVAKRSSDDFCLKLYTALTVHRPGWLSQYSNKIMDRTIKELWFNSWHKQEFNLLQSNLIRSEAHSASKTMGNTRSSHGIMLTTPLPLMLRVRQYGTTLPLPHMPSQCGA